MSFYSQVDLSCRQDQFKLQCRKILFVHVSHNTVDMIEFAMWWEGVECRTKQGDPLPDWTQSS